MDYDKNETWSGYSGYPDWTKNYPLHAFFVDAIKVIVVVVAILGIIGNGFTVTIISKWTKLSSGAVFMCSLAFTDALAVFYDGIINEFLPMAFEFELAEINVWICNACIWFSVMTTWSSYYLTIMFSLDKCWAVTLPFNYRIHGTSKLGILLTSIVYILFSLYAIPYAVVFGLTPDTGTCHRVDYSAMSATAFDIYNEEFGVVTNGIIPISVVFLTTGLSVYKLGTFSSKHDSATKVMGKRDAEITKQMIAVSIIFFILCSGWTAFTYMKHNLSRDNYLLLLANYLLLNALKDLFQALNNSLNFYLYIFFGQKFRQDFFKLVGLKGEKATTGGNTATDKVTKIQSTNGNDQ